MSEGIQDLLGLRTEGCRAKLCDNGEGKPKIPICMGASAVLGAERSFVGCVKPDECSSDYEPTPGWVYTYMQDDHGRVARIVEVRRSAPSDRYSS